MGDEEDVVRSIEKCHMGPGNSLEVSSRYFHRGKCGASRSSHGNAVPGVITVEPTSVVYCCQLMLLVKGKDCLNAGNSTTCVSPCLDVMNSYGGRDPALWAWEAALPKHLLSVCVEPQ